MRSKIAVTLRKCSPVKPDTDAGLRGMISKTTKKYFVFCMAFVLLPFYAFSIPFSELNFDSVDIESGITVEYPDYSIEMSDIKKSKGALTGETTFYCGTEEHKAKILFPKFTLYRDGSFKSGSSDKEESTYRLLF